MAPAIKRIGRINLQGSLDRDVYQVLKKLEDSVNDGRQFKSVYQAYEAVKKSNSSLSRQKKRPLEDSIERVLQFRKQEEDDSDSEAAIEKEEARRIPEQPEDARFLLNRQMAANWSTNKITTDDEPRAAKKRRIDRDNNDADDGLSEAKTPKGDSYKAEELSTEKPRKPQRLTKFKVEQSYEPSLLGGMGELSQQLIDKIGPIMRSVELFADNHYRKRSGFVVSGPPGSGKKSLVRNLALNLDLPLVSISSCLDDPERMEKSLNEAFEEAVRLAPCIIFLEDLDHYMSKGDGTGHNEHHRRAIRLFSRHMQKLAKEQPADRHVLALSTTSRIAEVDPLVLKTGLFSHTVQVKVPDLPMRMEIFKVVLGDTPVDDDLSLEELAKMTHGYVGADVVDLVTTAQECAATRALLSERDMTQGNGVDDDMGYDLREDGDLGSQYNVPTRVNSLKMGDFAQAIKDFVPSLRKEGFTVIPNVTWESVGALQKVREQLDVSIIGPIKDPGLYQTFGLTRPAGVLLWGPPGCGKTLVAQAVANAAQASFILINGPELLNKYVGESERAVRELFQRARSSTPCILFFDEIDSLVPRRDSASTEAGARVVNALLTELDGAMDRKGIYVIGTTNRPDMIDQAMLRPGRLSERLFVDLPTPPERVDILKAVYRTAYSSRPLSSTELGRLDKVASDKRCTDFSGADLAALHIKAAECALRNYLRGAGTKEIGEADWEWALANTTRSVLNPETYRKLDSKLGKAH